MCKKLVFFVTFALLLGLTGTALATDYYVSPSGNDNNTGTSPAQAWQTIDKVNSVTFSPGDSILFEGGQTFSGQLVFDNEAGTSTSPITVSSYGTGRATLSNPTMGVEGSSSTGLGIYNNAGFEINNLILVGPGNEGDRWDENVGVRLEANLGTAGARVDYIRIDNVEVSNYSGYGILIYGVGYSGFRDVAITNCVLHHIGKEGIGSSSSEWPMSQSSHNDFYIADCVIHDITGVGPRGPHSGSGINLSALDGALVEYNLAYSGGEWCMAEGGGPLGIWCWETENIVFQFNEVHHWQTLGGDGGGFDLDGGSSYAIVQYCYSHDNFGGDLLMQFGRSRPAHDYIYRYNINANNCQLNTMGAINFYTDTGSEPYNVEVYNNTVYLGPDSAPGASAVDVWYWKGGSYGNVSLRNNIFMAEAGKKLISYQKIAGITFQNNIYWQSGEPLVIDAMGTLYTSLADWRTATGQEMLDGSPVGMEIGPQLVDVHDHPVLGPHNLANLPGFKLKSSSQCRDAGLDLLALFGIDPGNRDYYGTSIPQGSLFDISAHEYQGGGSAPAPDSTPPSAPTGLTATATSSGIDLDWANNGESDISHYSVKRSTTSGGPYTQIISNLNASAYSDKKITPSTTYYYVVSAVDTSSNQSGNSNQTSASVTYPGVLIFSDSFESGDFTTGGWIVTGDNTAVSTKAAYEGTYGASIGKGDSIEKHLSTVGYTDIRIRYMRNTLNTARFGCSIAWWDGTDLHPIEKSIGEPWELKDLICSPVADNNPNFFIFFHESGPGPKECTYVDKVEIWGVGGGGPDTTPPSPDPMTFASPPAATGDSSIEMTATTATDVSGVEYYFDCVSGSGTDSGWQDGTYYQDTGLSPGTQYCYTVKARDKSPAQNETAPSGSACATTTQPDTTPPTPDPLTWATVPYATGPTSIAMVATTASDASPPVEYYFDCTTAGGHDSGWQTSTSYEDTGLQCETQYTYRVQARDSIPNVGGFSTSQSATTDSCGGDTDPPTPDPLTWATVPHSTGQTSIAMVATTASDASPPVEYYFDCTTAGGHDSGWQTSTSYEDTGLQCETQYTYRVQARDSIPNVGGFSTSQSATTDSCGGGPVIFSDGFESGNFTAGGWTISGSTATVTSAAAYTGSYGAKLGKMSWIEKAVSTSGYTDIHVKYARITGPKDPLDPGEEFTAEWYDGSNWNLLESTLDTNWAEKDWLCGSGANNNPNFKIRFSSSGTHPNAEYSYLDDVEVSGTQ